MDRKKIRTGITALALCLMIPFAAWGEVKAVSETKNGKVTETVWQDENGEPAAGPEGYASVQYTYKGENVFEMYFDAEGEPYETSGGYCGRRVKRDGRGNTVEIEYLDAQGQRTLNVAGYGQVVTVYTGFGEVGKVSYYGLGKKLALVPSLGYASVEIKYSGKTMTSRTYLDEKQQPVDCADGYASVKQKLNKHFQVLSIRYDHADGSPATGPDGWFRCVKDRDDKERLTCVSWYDVNMQPVDRGMGYVREEYEYEGENVLRITRYGLNGAVVPDSAGVAVTVREMKDGQVVKERFLDGDGNPTVNGDGVGAVVYSYGSDGSLAQVAYQDTEGAPVLSNEGFAGYRDEKDEDGATVGRIFLGTDGKPVEIPGGYCEIRYVYDELKQVASIGYYDLNGKQVQ